MLWLELYLQGSALYTGQLILYTLVPYLICMALMLRNIRLKSSKGMQKCALEMLGLILCLAAAANMAPGIYETSAIGIWTIAFFIFGTFFLREIIYILDTKKGGKMYGIVA